MQEILAKFLSAHQAQERMRDALRQLENDNRTLTSELEQSQRHGSECVEKLKTVERRVTELQAQLALKVTAGDRWSCVTSRITVDCCLCTRTSTLYSHVCSLSTVDCR